MTRTWTLVAALLLSCTGSAPEHREAPQAPITAAAAVARLRGIPILGARLDTAGELFPSTLGLAPRAPGAIRTVVPLSARAPMRIGRDDAHYFDITSDHEHDTKGFVEARSMVFVGASRDTDAFILAEADRVEEIRVLRTPSSPTTSRWRVKLGVGLSSLRARENLVEALDAEGRAWLRSEPIFAVDATGRRVVPKVEVSREGDAFVLETRLDVTDLEFPIALDPGWGATAAMSVARQLHAGAQLTDGRILVFGGNTTGSVGGPTNHSTAEIYDPATNTWTTTGSLSAAVSRATAVRLADGKVIALGGLSSATTTTYLSTSEVWNPATGVWTAGPALPKTWAEGRAHAIAGNKVCILGGMSTGGTSYNNGHVLDVAAGTWTVSANTQGLYGSNIHSTVLTSGKLLLVGQSGAGLSLVYTFDPATLLFSAVATPAVTRQQHAQVLLPSGKVLVAGSFAASYNDSTAELFDPTTATWSPAPSMFLKRSYVDGVLLSTGKVLVAGGALSASTAFPELDAEIYDPTASAWSLAGKLTVMRSGHLMFPLAAGGAIAIGGVVRPAVGTSTVSATVDLMADGVTTGAKCVSSGACASGYCADGVCCDAACTGKCQTCTATPGTCTSLSAPAAGKGTCDPYVCGAVDCKSTCAVDADCIASNYCNTTTGKCAVRVDKGATCTTASQCKTGFCADGVCCDKACDGACEACAESGSVGTCSKLDGVGDKHAKCLTTACTTTCVAGACGFKPAATPCGGASTCTGSTLTAVGKCAGTDERCLAGGTAPCPGSLVCADATTCKSKCSSDADCTAGKCDLPSGVCGAVADAGVDTGLDTGVADAGSDVGVADGSTKLPDHPAVAGDFTRCNKNSDCPSGHCVEGVCCDTACAEKCHTCALFTSPGKCTLAPIGVDLRNECGPALQCLGTCDGTGQCIGAGSGTMCARNRCTGQGTGVGPAYCPAPGGKCDIDGVVAFECGPYVCEPAFGACRSSCSTSLDCVNGFACDLPSKTCVPPAAPADGGGCSAGRTQAGGATVFLLVLGALARRRRST